MGKIIDGFWKFIESAMHFVVFKMHKTRPSEDKWDAFVQFVKFGIVGLTNNAISYVVYLVLIRLGMHYTPANIIGFTVSVFNSYYWNNKYVFKDEGGRVWWKTFIKTYISYAGTGIVLSNILLFIWIDFFGISAVVAPLINLIITVPINFIVNKFWAYKKVSGL